MRQLKLLTDVLITKYTKTVLITLLLTWIWLLNPLNPVFYYFNIDTAVMSLYCSLPLTLAELHRTLQCCSVYVYQAGRRVRTSKAVWLDGRFAFCTL